LVKAVLGLQEAMRNGGFSEPEACKKALKDYEFSCNSSALFINECIEFSLDFKATIGNSQLMDAYRAFCLERKLEVDSKNQFYGMLETLGGGVVQEKWLPKSSGSPERGYIGLMFRANTRMGF
jgi:phage/plasmid-associated DNA primase